MSTTGTRSLSWCERWKEVFISSLVVAGLSSGNLVAQDDPQQEPGKMMLEEVVVTGTPGGSEMRKLDASFAITNVDDEDIRRYSPRGPLMTASKRCRS